MAELLLFNLAIFEGEKPTYKHIYVFTTKIRTTLKENMYIFLFSWTQRVNNWIMVLSVKNLWWSNKQIHLFWSQISIMYFHLFKWINCVFLKFVKKCTHDKCDQYFLLLLVKDLIRSILWNITILPHIFIIDDFNYWTGYFFST